MVNTLWWSMMIYTGFLRIYKDMVRISWGYFMGVTLWSPMTTVIRCPQFLLGKSPWSCPFFRWLNAYFWRWIHANDCECPQIQGSLDHDWCLEIPDSIVSSIFHDSMNIPSHMKHPTPTSPGPRASSPSTAYLSFQGHLGGTYQCLSGGLSMGQISGKLSEDPEKIRKNSRRAGPWSNCWWSSCAVWRTVPDAQVATRWPMQHSARHGCRETLIWGFLKMRLPQ